MGLKEKLRTYTYWLEKKTPGHVLDEVKSVGKWTDLFPGRLPLWAHRVRNYFNLEPAILTLHNYNISENYYYKLAMLLMKIQNGTLPYWKLEEELAMSGFSYLDKDKNVWLQMSPGATIYHFEHTSNKKAKAVEMGGKGQSFTPVFKLISLDRSGGSRETIVKNPFTPKKINVPAELGVLDGLIGGAVVGISRQISIKQGNQTIGNGKEVNIKSLIQTVSKYQGSYNYGETSDAGFAAHKRFDMDTHEMSEAYVNPSDKNPDARFSDLYSRTFPEYAQGEQTALADQKWQDEK